MPAKPYESPGDWTSLPGGRESRPDPAAYADWQKRRDEYFANKDRDVSGTLGPATQADPRGAVSINADNYQVATEGDYIDLRRKQDLAAQRQGVQVNTGLADWARQQAYGARGRQQEAAMLHGAAAMGLAPSAAQAQMQMALDAQTQRAAGMGGARGVMAAQYGGGLAQAATNRMGESQAGYRGAAGSLFGMRQSDLATMRGSQDAAYAQAQLAAAQKARNDAMTRTYLGAEHNLALEQLAADQAYEAQKANNQLGVANQLEAQRRLAEEKAQREAAALMSGGSAAISGGASYLGKSGG